MTHVFLRVLALPALLALGACQDARLSVRLLETPEVPNGAVRVVVEGPGFHRILRGDALGSSARMAPEFDTPSHGTARIRIEVVDDVASTPRRELRLDLRDDWAWGVDIHADSGNPARLCLGCMGSRAFPLPAARRRTPRDSLWVTWGGNSISNPVVY